MNSTATPQIFILDLDGTIIGDCKYQSILYSIEKYFKKNGIKTKSTDFLNKSYSEKSKLIRPDLKYFMNTMREYYNNNVKFYIYTASTKEWANKEINLIEKNLNIKFDRPIFTRDDCIMNPDQTSKKSIKLILNKLYKKKIPSDINDKIIIIDDNPVYIDFTDKLILCPSYTYQIFFNYWDILPNQIFKNIFLVDYIKYLIINNQLCPYNYNNNINMKQKMLSYKWIYKICSIINKNNKNNNKIQDNFWRNLTKKLITS